MKRNSQLPNVHLRKDWKRRVRTWFDQPAKAQARRTTRARKAALIAPRPVDGPLRPAVRCPTVRYNMRLRVGRGFTHEEIKAAGLNAKYARTIGIAIDHRRTNKSEESLERNVQRLKAYLAKLIVFPLKAQKAKAAAFPAAHDAASVEEAQAVPQLQGPLFKVTSQKEATEVRAPTAEEKEFSGFRALRKARYNTLNKGTRATMAAKRAEAERN
ncbi:60S ribosomal protein L13 [Tieghemiomyces parasiticus]|uniref:60S ribosomal protein L13 n=1 Tax=Tieghemiomyces parasiticus TaxID=78921 RepID=A0A9W7ZNW2_9FUNG|nr:60S ribosomal protein L13 [Tieghemiomyces parasiticus]